MDEIWTARLASSTMTSGHAASMRLAFVTYSLARSTSAPSTATAREPNPTGFPACVNAPASGSSLNGPISNTVFTPARSLGTCQSNFDRESARRRGEPINTSHAQIEEL